MHGCMQMTYGEELQVLQQQPLAISVAVTPDTGQQSGACFVDARLECWTEAGYPDAVPAVRLLAAKGENC